MKTQGNHETIHPDAFADALEEIYEDPNCNIHIDRDKIKDVPAFTLPELLRAFGKMRNRRGADKSNVVVEMIKHGSPTLHQKVLDSFNHILSTGNIPTDWHVTIFSMLPKCGNLQCVSNWRPIAILPILYKAFTKMLYFRLEPILEQYQSKDQFGFRRNKRIDDVFCILENMIGRCNEWNVPLWMISLDLRKAFDRIQHEPLFEALREQGVPNPYIQLLAALYENQQGCVNGSRMFLIQRGVKQGDVLSTLLFNAGLEAAFCYWRTQLQTHVF